MARVGEWWWRGWAGLVRWGRKAAAGDAGWAFTCWLFLHLLGVIYLIAFLSLWMQLKGLVGHDGILPAAPFLQAARAQLGPAAYWVLPTACWLNASDAALQLLCALGVGAAVALILDRAPAAMLALLWASYLSLATVCRDFLWFQWDSLLLETGFLAVFLAPWRMSPAREPEPPPRLAVWLLRWLLFRLMVSSGAVKLSSGDPAWRTLTALVYHYETQPLPTWIGWYAHQLPAWFHRLSCAAMFAVEFAAPFAAFAPRPWRRAGAAVLAAFQLLIMATGNYTFFNLLAIILCLPLLDDDLWPARWRSALRRPAAPNEPVAPRTCPRWLLVPVACLLALATTVPALGAFHERARVPAPLAALYSALATWRVVGSYGLFAMMTTSRPEIIVEGSADGEVWQAYEFTDKPGDLRRRPRFVAPNQPRLDWQMWFAALGGYRNNPWFLSFCSQLLKGSPDVLALLAHNPFPDGPPHYLRALVYDYRFTDVAARRAEGAWWRREPKGLYCPMLSLRKEP